jgi:hypothetical protein
MGESRDEREAVARIVDPKAWDEHKDLLRRAKHWRDAGHASGDTLARTYGANAESVITDSLAKADAIIALLDPQTKEQPDVE